MVGMAESAHGVVINDDTAGRYDQTALTLVQVRAGDRLDTQRRAVRDNLDASWPQAEVITELLRNHETTCLVNGCSHA